MSSFTPYSGWYYDLGQAVTVTSVARAGVLTAVGTVAVRTVARSVVVVIGRVHEVALAPVTITDEGLTLAVPPSERDGDGIAGRVAATHGLAEPALVVTAAHGYLLMIVAFLPFRRVARRSEVA